MNISDFVDEYFVFFVYVGFMLDICICFCFFFFLLYRIRNIYEPKDVLYPQFMQCRLAKVSLNTARVNVTMCVVFLAFLLYFWIFENIGLNFCNYFLFPKKQKRILETMRQVFFLFKVMYLVFFSCYFDRKTTRHLNSFPSGFSGFPILFVVVKRKKP